MIGLGLLFATLIGVFITPDGIVVGADTAVSNRGGQLSSRQKYCLTGPRSVATLQGVYDLTDLETNATVALYDRFREWCAQRAPAFGSLEAQGSEFAEVLRGALDGFLRGVPAEEVVRKYSSDALVARIAVSGYDDLGQATVVVGLGVATDKATNRWEVQVRDLARLTLRACGVRFHGQEVVLNALRNQKDARIPADERAKPDVLRLTALIGGSCGGASTESAARMFAEATRLTMAFGNRFGIPPGAVNLPLDIIVIPRTGDVQVSRVVAW